MEENKYIHSPSVYAKEKKREEKVEADGGEEEEEGKMRS